MKRNAVVAVVIVAVIAALVWAGISNRHRRAAEEARVRQQQITLHPDTADGSASAPDAGDEAAPDLRGKTAPDFKLTTLDGKKVSLADYRGKPVLINFWATWCAPCKLEMPWLEEFQHKYAAQGFTILGVTTDDAEKDEIQHAVAHTGVTYPITLPDKKAEKAYGGIDYLPSSFYVDRSGKIVDQSTGLAKGGKDEIEASIRKIVGAGA